MAQPKSSYSFRYQTRLQPQLQLRFWLSLASSQKSCKSPAALHVFHALLLARTRTRTRIYICICMRICICVCIFGCCCSFGCICVCIGTCVRASLASLASSSSTWPLAAITISCGRCRRIAHIGFHVCHFCVRRTRLWQHFMLITRLIRSVCLKLMPSPPLQHFASRCCCSCS